MKILVLCTGNSARSILLEAILNTGSNGRVQAYSAGSDPTGRVHPQSLALLTAKGIDTTFARSQSWDDFAKPDAPSMDLVITVCGSAAGETCPIWPGAPITAHWGVQDPAAAPEQDWETAFTTAFNTLEKRAKALFDIPFETMNTQDLSAALTKLGRLT